MFHERYVKDGSNRPEAKLIKKTIRLGVQS
uniref:Uncharacterized protein n=1 Tax=Lepeophtheirus salmonis TaxID=72036 RepID=A0A0K2VK76_LEPSM